MSDELNVRQAEELVRKLSGIKPKPLVEKATKSADVKSLEASLRERLGTKVSLNPYRKRRDDRDPLLLGRRIGIPVKSDPGMRMDTLALTNARFYTFNPDQPIAERLIIQNRKIIAAGSAHEISLDSFPKAEIFDLKGKTVLPAFTDSHIHLLEYGLSLRRVACETATYAGMPPKGSREG